MGNERVIVVGDIHGCIEELDELLATVSYVKGKDRLFFVGDIVDRGPDSRMCIRRAKEVGAHVVQGNHDEKYVRYHAFEQGRLRTGKKNPMKLPPKKEKVYASLKDDDLAFMASWPKCLKIFDGFYMVHAGLSPSLGIEQQEENSYLRMRFVDPNGKFVSSAPGQRPKDGTEWSKVWKGPESVVYGHIVHDLWHPRIDQPAPGVIAYGIDTGCCFGGVLTAMIIKNQKLVDKPEFVRVRARGKYAKWLGDGGTE